MDNSASITIENQMDNFLEQFKLSASKDIDVEWSKCSSSGTDTGDSHFGSPQRQATQTQRLLQQTKSRSRCLETRELLDNVENGLVESQAVLMTVSQTQMQQRQQQQQYSQHMIESQNSVSSGASTQTVFFQSVTSSPAYASLESGILQHTASTISSNSTNSLNSLGVTYAAEALSAQRSAVQINSLLEYISPAEAVATMSGEGVLNIADVADLLHPQHAIITGGRSQDGCPLIIFPDNNNFNSLEEADYQKLILYLSSVPSLQDADLGFHLIVDRRKDRWTSVKTVLQRISSLEKFSSLTHQVSAELDVFIQAIHDTEFPNSVETTKKLLEDQGTDYARLKEEILAAAKHGETLLDKIKAIEELKEFSERTGNISAIERLLVQLEETERRFDEFWRTHCNRLEQCLHLRMFEQDFRELQNIFDGHMKTVAFMTEIGESVNRVVALIEETQEFCLLIESDIQNANKVIQSGQQLIGSRGVYPWEIVQPKCDELERVGKLIRMRLTRRLEILAKNSELMERVEKANQWCANGVELLASQRIEKCSVSEDLAEQSLHEIQAFIASASNFKLSSPSEFKKIFLESTTPETKALVSQVLQRIDDVSLMCDKRIASLKKLALKPPRPVQQVTPEPAVPLQPPGGAPHLLRRKQNKVQPTSRVPKPQEAPSYNESKVQLRVNQLFQKDLAQVHNVAPNWMFQKAASGNRAMEQAQPLSPRLQQKVKQERVHIRKKRQALNIVNRLTGDNVEGATGGDDGKSSHNYSHCSLSIIEQSECPKRLSLESGSDSGVSSSIDSKDQQIKEKNLCLYDKCIDCEKILQRQVPNKQKSYERSIGIPPFKALADPNDVQNFAKKNVTKPSTNDLLTAAFSASQAISKPIPKQCNIETERKLNNLSLHQCNTTICIDDIWVHESCIDSSDEYMEIDSFSLDPANSQFVHSLSSDNSNNSVKIYIGHSSSSNLPTTSRSISTSTSSSVCSGSLCDSEQDSCANCSSTTCNAIAGVFWNNACYDANDINTAATAIACCCSLSSCDDDDCSYYEGNFNVELNRSHQQSRRTLDYSIERNEKELQQKTIIMHELRPRSMDGVIDSVVTLNRDSGLSLESNQHMQSQQDVEAQKLKRGHVLSELLETERIYVNEMSSILKGYCDQMQSDELIHLVPASLQGKEDILFGNLHELFTFHNDIFLKDLENCISTTELVALCFVQRRDTFYRLYSFYCQNIPRSERLRETLVDTHLFLQECQKRLGHKLPLAAYLLKPVQRITKYQLLLKDLLKFSDSGSCTKELQKALDCMLIVLKCVNDSMHQVAITGFPTDLAQLGELLLQDSFQVWTESKKDIRLRIKPQQRHIFLYQKSLLFCKQTPKTSHSKSTYQFKHHLKMSQIGLTETVRGDPKRFEVWLQGRQEVHTLHAPTLEVKIKWVTEIKKVLLNQLEELKGEKIKQYGLNHRGLKQTTSWDTPNIIIGQHSRAINCDSSSESWSRNSNSSDNIGHAACTNSTGGAGIGDRDHPEACSWSSDYSNSEDELSLNEDISTPSVEVDLPEEALPK
ncbi:CG30440 [Drosophila busckii]|uniref:CG30440 n=1 Tax=Drosophila busckii TaxID=30019 RepID=A0A0M3QUI2_DROBS|nr:CG30440 [Drosophila busckii]